MSTEDEFDIDESYLGVPVDLLKDFEEEASPELKERVIRSLRRRRLGAHVLIFSWSALGAVAREFLSMVYSLVEPKESNRGGSD